MGCLEILVYFETLEILETLETLETPTTISKLSKISKISKVPGMFNIPKFWQADYNVLGRLEILVCSETLDFLEILETL